VGVALTSPRLRGEVGICALVVQIPGEGASPQALSGEAALAEKPPHPDPLPASGEREQNVGSNMADHAVASRTARVTRLAINGILNWL